MEPAPTPTDATDSEPSVWGQLAALVGLFLGGGVGGALLAERLAPDSILASAAGLFALPLTFASGLQLWLGTALLLAVIDRLRGRPFIREPGRRPVPGGAWVFIPVAVAFNGLAGVVVAFAGSSIGWLATVVLYPMLGAAYGAACWFLANRGYLRFQDYG